jgi:hypothetical protein
MKEHIMGCDVFQPLFAQNGIYFSFRIKIFSNLILQIAHYNTLQNCLAAQEPRG